jgi:hypothetical protein
MASGDRRWPVRRPPAALVLAGLGAASLACYLAVFLLSPQSPRYLAKTRAVLIEQLPLWAAVPPLPGADPAPAVLAIALAAGILVPACYAASLWMTWRRPADRSIVAVAAGAMVLFQLASVLALPNASSDLYLYLLYQRVFNVHHVNPYAVPAAAFPSDPYLPFGDPNQVQLVLPYGPTWAYLSILWGRLLSEHLSGEDVVRTLLGFRALLAGFNLASAGLVWAILSRLAPAHRLAGLISYAWNPIVVLEGREHTEAPMVFLLLLGAYLCLHRRHGVAVAALTFSALTKFVTAPLLLGYLAHLSCRRSLRIALAAGALASALVVLAFLPLWDGWRMVPRVLRDPDQAIEGSLMTPRRLLLTPGFLLFVLWTSWRWRETVHGVIRGWTAAMLYFALFLAPINLPYYLIPLVAVTSLVESPGLVGAVVALSCLSWTHELVWFARPYLSFPDRPWAVLRVALPLLVLTWFHRTALRRSLAAAKLRRSLIPRAVRSQLGPPPELPPRRGFHIG